jgi:glycosidase
MPQQPWWDDAIFYEIFVRSFYDTNGDGIGDFNGVTAKLDYLQQLGINAIWLMPIHPSPSYHGYDVINYYNVNPDYGSMEDFKRMVNEAHKRGIRVIIDLVLNHTSDQNPLFIDANNNPGSPYRNWYIWSDTDPGYAGPLGTAWHPGKSGFYYGIFSASMPDLNYENQAVTDGMYKVVNFWLNNVGIDGFRLDAVKYLIEEGQKQENTASTHQWLRNFYTFYKSGKPDAYTVGEVYGAGGFLAKTYTGDQLDQIFNFEMASGFVNSAAGEATSGVNSAIKFSLKDMPNGQYATFLTNHDQNRVMSVLSGNLNKAKVAASLLLTAPGTPFIYYGEEVGMEGEKPDEDIRLPMQWSGEANAGFTSGIPWRNPGTNYQTANVASEINDPASLLSRYRDLIALRKQQPTLRYGSLTLVETGNPGVYAILRVYENNAILVVINLTKKPVADYTLSLQDPVLQDGVYHLENLFGDASASGLTVAGGTFSSLIPLAELAAYSTQIWKLIP